MIKAFLKMQNANLVCLQETKLQGITRGLIRSLSVGRFVDWVDVNAVGSLEVILIFWDSRLFQLMDVEESRFALSCKFRSLEDNFTWFFMGVYGPTGREEREILWDDLGDIRGLWGEPWCQGVDFT